MPPDEVASGCGHGYVKLPCEPLPPASPLVEPVRIFEELPRAIIVSVSEPDATDVAPLLLSYTIELHYKQFKWSLVKKATQVFSLHLALKKRILIEEFHGKQEQSLAPYIHGLFQILTSTGLLRLSSATDDFAQTTSTRIYDYSWVGFSAKSSRKFARMHKLLQIIHKIYSNSVKEWLQYLGLGEHSTVVHEDDESVPIQSEENSSARNRNVPSRAALPIIRPALGSHQSVAERAKVSMQGYLNHFLKNLDIVNSCEVCKFLEVSRLSFSPEYGPKLKENYVAVRHLRNIRKGNDSGRCCACHWFSCCDRSWQKVWAVLKPGFLALLEDPFDTKLLDIIIFDVLPPSVGKGENNISLVTETKERNPLRFGFAVSFGNRTIKFRTMKSAEVKEWVASINDAVLWPSEGWCQPHRFGSFAPQRGLIEDGSHVQWFVDGEAAFDAIASSIEEAKSEIFITDWWLCPELYMRRPFHIHGASRLDVLLGAKAKQGVQIYILLYQEVAIALKINSVYSKRKLLDIHENVKVLRYPDHFSTGVYLWSHHEKIVIVDNRICYIGGLDLCFGRYDTVEHKVGDIPPLIWPGNDYYNPRESEPNSWEDSMKDELDRKRYPRMPWHDVHCAVWGPPCRDVARHFVQRWNYAKRNKAPNEKAIPLLMPQQHMVIPHYLGKNREVDVQHKQHANHDTKRHDSFSSCPSYQDIPLLLPKEPNGPAADGNTKNVDKEWWETQERGDQVVSLDEVGQVGPRTSCRCQVIRSVGQWSAGTSQTEESIHNAYISLIEKAEYFIYIENQFFISGLSGDDTIRNRVLEALYRRILRAEKEKSCFRVIIVIPLLPGFQGGLDDGGAASVRALIHWQYRTISRGPNSILQSLYSMMGPKTHDYISFYGLRTYGRLCEGGLMATNQVYVHSKLMVVDDRIVLLGSANINDRSLLGSRDSEIGMVVEDKNFVSSFMNGRPWRAGKFALSLRLSLWSEHLGLDAAEINKICDPVTNATYKDIWMETAKTNTIIYHDVFACIPNDLVHSRAAIRQSTAYWKEKLGHTTIDLGIAPNKLEACENGDRKDTDPLERLKSVRGHLVSFPLEFMRQEDLRPLFLEGEFYVSPQVFH